MASFAEGQRIASLKEDLVVEGIKPTVKLRTGFWMENCFLDL